MLAVNRKNGSEIHVIEINIVTNSMAEKGEDAGESKNAGKSRDVVENKCWKNADLGVHHDIYDNNEVIFSSPRCL